MKIKDLIKVAAVCAVFAFTGCIDNNNKDKQGEASGTQQESDNEQDAPTYNKTRDEMNDSTATATPEKRVPSDPVERQSKGNAASE